MAERSYETMRDVQGFFRTGQRYLIYKAAKNDRDKVLIRLLWATGRRITEILNVKVSDIDFERRGIFWHIEKKTQTFINEAGDKTRVKKDLIKFKPLDSQTLTLLSKYIEHYKIPYNYYILLSSYDENKPITRQRAFQIIRDCSKRAGIELVGNKKPHPHHFRHTFAIDMARRLKTPADTRKLQMMLEHANLGITEQYLQFSDQDIRELLEDLDT